jgi:2-hydroxychromene-2-carboxylate isomerase
VSKQFKDQGGAAKMDPSRFRRWVTSKIMTKLISIETLTKKREKEERKRKLGAKPHIVEYFHQVDDGYSHLAAQALEPLLARYNVEIKCHLVGPPEGNNSPEPVLLMELSRYDAAKIAPYYGLDFPDCTKMPNQSIVESVKSILSVLSNTDFVLHAKIIGQALWASDQSALDELKAVWGTSSDAEVSERYATGNARRAALKHYSGGMFYYGGEWYWGVDRLYHLENRLSDLGLDRNPGSQLIMPRQEIRVSQEAIDSSLTLECFVSLRSPYTAIVFERALELGRSMGVTIEVRPVLPMVMRGVPATMEKGMYIFGDCAREARAANIPFGNFYDPIGEPARRCYSLYPWAVNQGLGNELLSSFLRAAFVDGINTNRDAGLQRVVERAGLDWSVAKTLVGLDGWQDELEANRLVMYESGLWGVPSFRLLDNHKQTIASLWGQDRLWLIANIIEQYLEVEK